MNMPPLFQSDTVKSKYLHTITIVAAILSRLGAVCERILASSAYSISHRVRTPSSFCQVPLHSFTTDYFSRFCTHVKNRKISLSLLNLAKVICSTTVKKMLNSDGAMMQL